MKVITITASVLILLGAIQAEDSSLEYSKIQVGIALK